MVFPPVIIFLQKSPRNNTALFDFFLAFWHDVPCKVRNIQNKNVPNLGTGEEFVMKSIKIAPGLTFSPNKALGITKVKRKISKATGIPTTKAGRAKKAARMFGIK